MMKKERRDEDKEGRIGGKGRMKGKEGVGRGGEGEMRG